MDDASCVCKIPSKHANKAAHGFFRVYIHISIIIRVYIYMRPCENESARGCCPKKWTKSNGSLDGLFQKIILMGFVWSCVRGPCVCVCRQSMCGAHKPNSNIYTYIQCEAISLWRNRAFIKWGGMGGGTHYLYIYGWKKRIDICGFIYQIPTFIYEMCLCLLSAQHIYVYIWINVDYVLCLFMYI